LNNGLIVEIEITEGGVSLDDFFEAALTTENQAVHGTYSVEVRDWRGNVLGEGVYGNNIPVSDEIYYENEEPEHNLGEDYNEYTTEYATTPELPYYPKDGTYPTTEYTTIPDTTPLEYTTESEYTTALEYTTAYEYTTPEYTTEYTTAPEYTTNGGTDEVYAGNPPTGNANIITATAMTIVSAIAVISMAKKNNKKSNDDE
jgi:hypothetical protein